MKLQSTFCVSVRSWLHSHISAFHLYWPCGYHETKYRGQWPCETLLKEQGSSNLGQNMKQKGPVWRPRCIGPGRLEPKCHSFTGIFLICILCSLFCTTNIFIKNLRYKNLLLIYRVRQKKCEHTLTKENSMLYVSTKFNYISQIEYKLQ